MTFEQKVASLTTSVDQLTDTVNIKKQTLDASVADSESARDQSQGYRAEARTARDESQFHANTALSYSQDAASAVAYQDLTSIAQTKSETAVDLFVYDTSKDSDGGAWRRRTQHTSWYNETLNTSTRGSRRKFPAVAVIVAESDTVTIYDGDDPALPMWMVFLTASGRMVYRGTSLSGVSALNGLMCVGASGIGGLTEVSFSKDFGDLRIDNSNRYNGSAILNRNVNGGDNITGSGEEIISRGVNDVAMTVLPDAPIDQATGLPIPTITAATDGGVSVIKDDGTVVDITGGIGVETDYYHISFDDQNRLYFTNRLDSTYPIVFNAVPSSDVSVSTADVVYGITGSSYTPNTGTYLKSNVGEIDSYLPIAAAGVGGLFPLATNFSSPPKSMQATITSTYNTGWMNGDIKGAFLSDTDDTDLVGATIFDVDFSTYADQAAAETDGWAFGTGWSLAGGQAVFTAGSGTGKLRRSVPLSPDASYLVQVDGTYGSGGSYVSLVLSAQGTFAGGIGSGAKVFTVDGSGGSQFFEVSAGENGDYFLDTTSFKLADAGRSMNNDGIINYNNGLIINGTVTRSVVDTGADLVAYSGFSGSNYLEQPYNSDLNFGTGDFCVMGWVNTASGTSNIQYILDSRTSSLSDGFYAVLVDGIPQIATSDGGSGTSTSGTSDLRNGTWAFVCGIVKDSGTTRQVYVNGLLETSSTGVTARNVSDTSRTTKVGIRADAGATPFRGFLALLRISATAPTSEQIKRIYEDEKVLFQENAQATLYGTSDAVTALAHDKGTNLLHVGTSDGRSVFQGLRRVDNTIDPVSTAISASNGLTVED